MSRTAESWHWPPTATHAGTVHERTRSIGSPGNVMGTLDTETVSVTGVGGAWAYEGCWAVPARNSLAHLHALPGVRNPTPWARCGPAWSCSTPQLWCAGIFLGCSSGSRTGLSLFIGDNGPNNRAGYPLSWIGCWKVPQLENLLFNWWTM